MSDQSVSVILVSFNTSDLTVNCLKSLYQYVKCDFETIVVDNNSTDDTITKINSLKLKNLKIIKSNTNLGFGKGNNLGVKHAKGEFVLLLNTDTVFIEDCVSPLLETFRSKPFGFASVRLLNKDLTIQNSGGSFLTLFNLALWQFGLDDLPVLNQLTTSFHPHLNLLDLSKYQPNWLTGAFLLIPKKNYLQVGGFDENIFMYVEELEFEYRLALEKLYGYFDHRHSLVHLGGASGTKGSALVSEVKGILYFYQKHKSKIEFMFAKKIIQIGSLLRWLFFGIIKRDERARHTYWEAIRLTA